MYGNPACALGLRPTSAPRGPVGIAHRRRVVDQLVMPGAGKTRRRFRPRLTLLPTWQGG
jgi:hypothetical protein